MRTFQKCRWTISLPHRLSPSATDLPSKFIATIAILAALSVVRPVADIYGFFTLALNAPVYWFIYR